MLKKALNRSSQIRFGHFAFDRHKLLLAQQGHEIDAPRRSLALLARLTEEPGEVVAKQDLIDSVWGPTHVSPTSRKSRVKEDIHLWNWCCKTLAALVSRAGARCRDLIQA